MDSTPWIVVTVSTFDDVSALPYHLRFGIFEELATYLAMNTNYSNYLFYRDDDGYSAYIDCCRDFYTSMDEEVEINFDEQPIFKGMSLTVRCRKDHENDIRYLIQHICCETRKTFCSIVEYQAQLGPIWSIYSDSRVA